MTFWVEDFPALVKSFQLIPNKEMSRDELYNTYSRLIILASLIALIAKYKYWYMILIIGLAVVICAYYATSDKKKSGNDQRNELGEYKPMEYSIYTQTPRKTCPYNESYHNPTQITSLSNLSWKPLSILKPFPQDYMSNPSGPRDDNMYQQTPFPPVSEWELQNIPDGRPKRSYYDQYHALVNCGDSDKEIKKLSTVAFDIYSDRMQSDSVVRDASQMQMMTFFGSLLGKTPSCY